jgi:hypothetical protein
MNEEKEGERDEEMDRQVERVRRRAVDADIEMVDDEIDGEQRDKRRIPARRAGRWRRALQK